ncbi:hypothetical protein ACJRO7_001157 [Eucalyptus globulus]|uniref:GOST seven transmembrane domain-containing protein n=1 Tax=Eucalyptus globulus TaxID=34317 RepID=A0ABD3LU14_EUCGL
MAKPPLLLLLLLLLSPAVAEIKTLTIASDALPPPGPPRAPAQPARFCVLDSHYVVLLFTFRELPPPPTTVGTSCSASSSSFAVLVLIGTGGSFLKPFLQEREKKVLMIAIPLQVSANLASAVTYNQVFLLVDIICCCATIFPIVWSIRSLRETSKTDGKAARQLFRQFYIMVIGYLNFTRIYQWVSNAAEETVSLAFCAVMVYMFRPVERNECVALDEEQEKEPEMVLREEEFEL